MYVSAHPYGEGNVVYEREGLTGTTVTVPDGRLVPGQRYRWNVSAANGAGQTFSTARLFFRTAEGETPTGRPEPISPGEASTSERLATLTPTLTWSGVSGASSYTVFVSEHPYGPGNLVLEREVSGTTFTVPSGELSASRRYRWNVAAAFPDGLRYSLGRLLFETTGVSGGDPPAVASVAPTRPNTGVQGLTLRGTSFPADARVELRNVDFGGGTTVAFEDVRRVSSGELRITADLGATSADWTATVIGGGGASDPFPFRVVRSPSGEPQGARLASVSPSAVDGGRAQSATLYGSGLGNGRVLLRPAGGQETSVSATSSSGSSLTFSYTFPAETATWSVQVETASGERTGAVSIQVTGPPTVQPRELAIGGLTLRAEQAEETRPGVYLVSGTATIGDVLSVSDASFTADTNTGALAGTGAFTAHGVTLFVGSFSVNVSGAVLTYAGNGLLSSLDVAGAEVTVQSIAFVGDELRLAGELKLLGLKADVPDLRIGRNGLQLRSTVELPEFGLPLGSPVLVPGLRKVTLGINTATRAFSGTGELVMPLISFRGAIGLLDGQLETFGVGVSGFAAIPLGSTGFGITGGYAELNGLAGLAGSRLALAMKGDIAPLVPGAFNSFLMEDVGFEYVSGERFRADGTLAIFGQRTAGAGFQVERNRIQADAHIEIVGVVEGKALVSVSNQSSILHVSGSLDGRASIKEEDIQSIWGGKTYIKILNKARVTFPITLAASEMRFSNSGLRVLQKVGGLKVCFDLAFRPPYIPDARCTLDRGSGRGAARMVAGGMAPEGGTFGVDAPNAGLRMTASGMEQRFSVGDGIEALVLGVDRDGGVPSVRLRLPDGTELGPGTDSDFFIYTEVVEENLVALYVQSPPPGEYVLATEGRDSHRLEIASQASQGAVVVDDISVANGVAGLTWRGRDGASGEGVSLYYDDDGEGFDGVLIERNLPATPAEPYVWTPTEDLATGDYHLYVSVGDGSRAVYAPGSLRYVPEGGPAPPDGVDARTTDDGVVVTWEPVDGRSYTVYHARRGAPSYSSPSVNAGAGRAVVVDGLEPGRTYSFVVSAQGETGVEGALSNAVSVSYVSASLNNAPTVVSSSAPARAVSETTLNVDLRATDPDGDALEYVLRRGPDGLTLSPSGRLSWTPAREQLGPHLVRLAVRDGAGASDSLAFRVQVAPSGGSVGSVAFGQGRYEDYDAPVVVSLLDPDLDLDPTLAERAEVVVSGSAGTSLRVPLVESAVGAGRFVGSFGVSPDGSGGSLRVADGDTLRATYADAAPSQVTTARAVFGTSSGPVNAAPAPEAVYSMGRPYPNPTVHRVYFEYAVASAGPVTVKVYDVRGRQVATLVDGPVPAGVHMAEWNATVAAGTYVIRFEAETPSGPVQSSYRVTVVR